MAAGQAAYPKRWETDVVLADGGTVHIRPLTPDDASAIEQFHARQSRDSIYFRYFSPMPSLTARHLERLTSVDYVTRMAFIALLGDDVIGMASYDMWPGRNEAEVAFIVDDAQQRRGLATVLLEYLVVAARENGVESLNAQVLPSNRRMVSVFHQVGFEVTSTFAEGVIEVRFDLEPSAQSQAVIDERERRSEARSIERVLFPSSIAVIGAGRDPDSLGNRAYRNLIHFGFEGRVFPVSPQAVSVDGARGHASVEEIEEDIDLAVVAVPAAAVPVVVEECGRKRVHGLVVISAGLAELELDGVSVEQRIVERALRFGMRVIGPESLGVINTAPEARVLATFADVAVSEGPVGFLTQSGTLGMAALEHAARVGVGISAFVDIGSRRDVSGNDLLQYWRDDPRTTVVLLYLETFGNPRKFTRIAREIARTKPIIAVKSGRTLPAGVDDPSEGLATVWPANATADAMLAQSGVIRVETPAEMFDLARVLLHQPVPNGRGVAVVCNSKGALVLAADACARAELDVVTAEQLTWRAGPTAYGEAIRRVLAVDDVDAVIVVYAPPMADAGADVGTSVVKAIKAHEVAGGRRKTALATFLGGGTLSEFTAGDVTIPLFEFPGEAAHLLGRLASYAEWLSRAEGTVTAVPPEVLARVRSEVSAVLEARPEGRWLRRDAAAALLRAAGFSLAEHRMVDSLDDAKRAANEIGYPVVLKATGVERFHRGEGGGVALDLYDDAGLQGAYHRMVDVLGDAMHPAVVQTMVPPGADVLVGAHQHPSFGGVVSVGIGGVMAAANPELPMRILPLTDADALRLVESAPIAPLLAAEHPDNAARDALCRFLAQMSAVLDEIPEIADVLLNPLIVDGTGVCIVDAWVRVAPYRWDLSPAVRRLT